ncbi:MAG TPA: RNA methyltransferase [Actinomycetota bacterium]|nr:RNA methyltransferase [Actinomycetota bacterium]
MNRGVLVGGRRTVLEAVRSGRAREVLIAVTARSTAGLREVLQACAGAGLAPRQVARRELDALIDGHHGVVARVDVPSPIGERELSSWPFGQDDVVVVLDGIEDPQNLGAAARSAEAAGAVMLVTRTRRAADVTPAAVRASAGALLHLPQARVANLPRALERLHGIGFTVVGLDERADRAAYEEAAPAGRLAVVVGAEGKGLARLSREACDVLIALPMHGRVGSLNASAALAAVLYAYVLSSRRGRPA